MGDTGCSQEVKGSVSPQQTMGYIKHEQESSIKLLYGGHVSRPELHPAAMGMVSTELECERGTSASLVLRQRYGAVRVIVIASHLSQVKSTHDTSENHIEELEALHILDCGHQCHCDGDRCTISLTNSI